MKSNSQQGELEGSVCVLLVFFFFAMALWNKGSALQAHGNVDSMHFSDSRPPRVGPFLRVCSLVLLGPVSEAGCGAKTPAKQGGLLR